ncbi:MAG TPA: hypothetical protein VN151_00950 [Terracidiphilus sp.]|nr:hypothetical protein [Terracidiphilus sp.]
MNIRLLFAAACIACSVPLAAQQASASASQSTSATAQGAQVNAATAAGADANSSAQLQPVNAELVGKLDSKSAKVGDTVVAKTTSKVRTADGSMLPKGSRLVGHITSVQAHGAGHADSSLGLVFNRAELKDGQSFAIHSVLESVAPPVSMAAASSSEDDVAMSAPMGATAARGGGRTGGGLLGGGAGLASSATAATATTVNSAAEGAARTTGSLAQNTTEDVAAGARATAATTGQMATHTTAIPGVMLAGDATGAASGTLTATNRNVSLSSGTQLVLGLAATAH